MITVYNTKEEAQKEIRNMGRQMAFNYIRREVEAGEVFTNLIQTYCMERNYYSNRQIAVYDPFTEGWAIEAK